MQKTINKVLIIKTSSIGDIINTLPAITDASTILPTTTFDWVIEKKFSQIAAWHPKIYKVIPISIRCWKRNFYNLTLYKTYFNFIRQLQQKKYDIIIDAQGLIKSSFFITYFAQGEKHGMSYNSIREPIASLCYDKKHTISKKQHAIERIRQLFALSLKYPIPCTIGQYGISHKFKQTINTIDPYLIFLHTTSNSKKCWPEPYWRILIQKAIKCGYLIKLPYWSKHEKSKTYKLIDGLDHIIVLPMLTLTDMAIQIASAYAIISVDTGLSHLAAALSCPNLTLYGPTDPKLIGKYGKNQRTLCTQTKKMRDITPEHVWKTFQILLKQCY